MLLISLQTKSSIYLWFYVFRLVSHTCSSFLFTFPMIGKNAQKVSNDWKNRKKSFQWLETLPIGESAFICVGCSVFYIIDLDSEG